MIEKRDRARQKELKFIHYYVELFEKDAMDVVAEYGRMEIVELGSAGEDNIDEKENEKEDKETEKKADLE